MNTTDILTALRSFLSQPLGVSGAFFIMFAVTAFNSKWIQDRLTRPELGKEWMSVILNGLNLIGGILLLINAVKRSDMLAIVISMSRSAAMAARDRLHRLAAQLQRASLRRHLTAHGGYELGRHERGFHPVNPCKRSTGNSDANLVGGLWRANAQ